MLLLKYKFGIDDHLIDRRTVAALTRRFTIAPRFVHYLDKVGHIDVL